MNLQDDTHKRLNILTGEWVLVSPHRTKRPWQGRVEEAQREEMPAYDPKCYLCPGNERAGGVKNPDYPDTLVFANDFSALISTSATGKSNEEDLLVAEGETGICKVVCFSPRHDLTFARMKAADIRKVVDLWVDEYLELGGREDIRYVQIFENRGALMGCSNPHPHGQIWSNLSVPDLPSREGEAQERYRRKKDGCLLCNYLRLELAKEERIVLQNRSFVALVPFWAVWPYETMILPRRHRRSIDEMDEAERDDLAEIMRQMGICFDNLFLTGFPYSMGIHQKPTDGGAHEGWHFHLHYAPPLLRSATVKKFMVGYELMATPQRDITAEGAAKTLRELPGIHYRDL